MGKTALTYDQLAARFESLGEDCEFGYVQRFFGAEPLGLLRFTAVRLRAVIDVVATEGSYLFNEEDLNIYYFESLDEYLMGSWHYGDFHTHTFLGKKDGDLETLRPKRLKILTYLKKKFFEDMRQAEKIYVRRGADSIVDLKRLHGALNVYAKNTLLCIAEADRDHEAGSVEEIEEGIWRGYVKRFKNFNRDTPIDLVSWARILERVHRARDPRSKLQRTHSLARGRGLKVEPHLAMKIGAKPLAGLSNIRLRLQQSTGREVRTVASHPLTTDVDAKVVVVFSIWIRIDRDFNGAKIVPSIDLPSFHTHPADLEQRGRWQRIWTTAQLPAGRRESILSIKIIAPQGGVLTIGDWSVDIGPAPRAKAWRSRLGAIGRLTRNGTRRLTSLASSIESKSGDVLQRSSLAMARGSYIQAEDMLATALAKAPSDPALLKQYAFCAHNKGNFNRAVDRWSEALKVAPDDAMCHAGVAANFREGGNWPAAVPVIEKALGLFPEDSTILTEAARIAMARSRPGDAVLFLERAIAVHGPIPELTTPRDEAVAQHEAEGRREAGKPVDSEDSPATEGATALRRVWAE